MNLASLFRRPQPVPKRTHPKQDHQIFRQSETPPDITYALGTGGGADEDTKRKIPQVAAAPEAG